MKKRIALSIICGVFFFILVSPASAFVKIGEGGFGDSANSYSWSVLPFKGNLYVGTNRHHLHSMMEPCPTCRALPSLLKRCLPICCPIRPPDHVVCPDWADAFQGEIWRYNQKNQWERVHQSGIWPMTRPTAQIMRQLPMGTGRWPNSTAICTHAG